MKTICMTSEINKKVNVKRPITRILIFVAIIVLFSTVKAQRHSEKAPGFAVLELYTSEGCSSCPPAEALLEQIAKVTAGQSVYLLAFHVDYFDQLGWKDSFGQHQFTLRQYDYSQKLSSQVYTPQLIVNGTTYGVGSDVKYVQESLSRALQQAAMASLEITAKIQSSEALLTYQVQGQSKGTELMVALVQKRAVSRVIRGENKGRTLVHSGVVRSLERYKTDKDNGGTVAFRLPAGFNWDDYALVGFLQHRTTGAIVAATRVAG